MENLITCQICGKQSTRIYGRHLKHHGLTSEEYLKLYPGAQLYSESDNEKTTINSGKHMKQEKYKKMFSEKIKGDKNPNSKIKTTDEQRKERSPFSKSFKKYKNENECIEFSKKVHENITPEQQSTRIEYWLNKGYNETEAKQKLSKRQTTFSLEKCIEKYGEIKGKQSWIDRQEKWITNYKKSNFSKISQKLFWSLYEILDNKNDVYFATLKYNLIDNSGKNNEYRLKLSNIVILPDFFVKNDKKIIEFDGTYYHRINPENKKRTLRRDEELKNDGYSIHHVNEIDYKKNPDKVISECLSFLKNKNNM